jgi:lysozyme
MARPNILNAKPQILIDSFGIDREKYPVVLLGIRGYYSKRGLTKGNDRNIFDDAIFVDIRLSTKSIFKSACYSFNGNTDPSLVRQGAGIIDGEKGMFVLDPGVYYAHRIGVHVGRKSRHAALVQWDQGENKKTSENKGRVKGHRDGGVKGKKNVPYPVDYGNYSINIHRGGYNTTVSEGCQTIIRSQFNEFISLVKAEMKSIFQDDFKTKTIPYCLVTNQEHKDILANHASANKAVAVTVTDKKTKMTVTKQVAGSTVATTKKAVEAAKAAAKESVSAAKKAADEAAAAAKKATKAADTAKKAAAVATASAKKASKAAAAAKKVADGLGKA